MGDEPTLTEFDPVHEHPEEDQEIKATDNLDITVSFSDPIQLGQNLEVTLPNPLQLEKKRSGPDTWRQFKPTLK